MAHHAESKQIWFLLFLTPVISSPTSPKSVSLSKPQMFSPQLSLGKKMRKSNDCRRNFELSYFRRGKTKTPLILLFFFFCDIRSPKFGQLLTIYKITKDKRVCKSTCSNLRQAGAPLLKRLMAEFLISCRSEKDSLPDTNLDSQSTCLLYSGKLFISKSHSSYPVLPKTQ